jgi:mRNA interferase MazF
MINQGEIWWVEEPGDKPRPCLVITRNQALPLLTSIMVAPLTRTRRWIPTEVALGPDDGVRIESVAAFDNLKSVRRSSLTRPAGMLAPGRWQEVCEAMRAAIGC